jgi:hypothetical protein
MNVVQRPTLAGGRGYEITGHHELMVPLLVWGVVEGLDDRDQGSGIRDQEAGEPRSRGGAGRPPDP